MFYNNKEWQYYKGALILKSAPHIELHLSKHDKRNLLKKSKAYFLRYETDWDIKEKKEFWYIIKDKFNGFDELSRSTRSKVRRGLKNCIVKKVSKEEIANNGYNMYKESFKRYDKYIKLLPINVFQKKILDSCDNDFFAVYNLKNEIIAYSINNNNDNSCNYFTIRFHPKYLKLYSSYALFYEMNKYYLKELGFLYVTDGTRSISHNTNIHNHLISKFNFRKAYCKLNIVYRRDIAIAVKILFPFRKLICFFSSKTAKIITVLLKQEEIRRSYFVR